MGLMDFIKGELIEIIEWTDDSRDTLSYRFPDDDKEIKKGAQLIVRESQTAQFVYLGQFGDTFGPGKYTLTTDNIPVLTTLKGWKYGFESPFKADVYYVITRIFTGNKWGTSNPVMMRDADFGIVRLRAFGTYDFRIVEPQRFLKEVAGTDQHFRLDEFADAMRSRLVSVFSDALASSKVPALDVATRYTELGDALLPLINPVIKEKYGIEMVSFILENVSVPPEVEAAIDKRSSMAAVGNLNDYVKYQMAQGLEKGGSGVGGLGAELAVGASIAQQMLNQPGGIMSQATAPAAGPSGIDRRRVARARRSGRRREGARRFGSRRDREPRVGRSQGQEDRHAVADHEDRSPRVPWLAAGSLASNEQSATARQKYACPACGAEAHWNAAKQALVCPFCGTESPATLQTRGADTVIVEHDLAAALRDIPDSKRGWQTAKVSVKCQSCQAISVFDPERVGQRCEFCGSAQLVPYEQVKEAFSPESLLPFAIDESRARELVRAWYGRQWLAPNNLTKRALTDTVHGLYLPYWTFDARVTPRGPRSRAATTTRTSTASACRRCNGHTRQARSITSSTTSWWPRRPVCPLECCASIEPFPTQTLIPYDPGYLAGWTVERYQIDLLNAASLSRAAMDAKLRQLCAAQVPGDTQRNLQVDARYSDQRFKHILVPSLAADLHLRRARSIMWPPTA